MLLRLCSTPSPVQDAALFLWCCLLCSSPAPATATAPHCAEISWGSPNLPPSFQSCASQGCSLDPRNGSHRSMSVPALFQRLFHDFHGFAMSGAPLKWQDGGFWLQSCLSQTIAVKFCFQWWHFKARLDGAWRNLVCPWQGVELALRSLRTQTILWFCDLWQHRQAFTVRLGICKESQSLKGSKKFFCTHHRKN